MDIIIPDIVAFILVGVIVGGFFGIILSFMFHTNAFFFAGLLSGVVTGALVHWLSKHNVQIARPMPDPTSVAAPASDPQHVVNSFERIFHSWADHSNFVAACGVAVAVIIAWMAVKLARISAESRHQPYYPQHALPPLPPGLEHYYQPRQLEDHRPKESRNLPAVRSDDARTI